MEHCSLAQRLVKHWAPMPAREDETRGNLYVVPTLGKLSRLFTHGYYTNHGLRSKGSRNSQAAMDYLVAH